jgi:hypothetical protein
MRLDAAVLALTLIWSAPLMAQSTPDPASRDTAPVYNVFATRTATALLAWVPGAIIGGYIGAHVPHSPCSCDDPGLREIVIGLAIGGTLGAGFGAAGPRLNSHCSFAHRLGLGLVGSVVGAGVGMIPITEGAQPITIPVFSIIGAALAEWPC